jgi:Ni/Co efflux regulator RcnB
MTRTLSTLLLALMAAACLALPVGAADAATDPALNPAQQQLWDEARQAFREHRYAAAYGRFATLADSGHAPSAHLALTMLRQGPVLFGSAWTASVPQQRRWSVLAVEDTRRQWLVDAAGAAD